MTAPPPPPGEDPTLVAPAGRRVAVDEQVGPPPGPPRVVRPYPWWLWVLMALFLAAAILFGAGGEKAAAQIGQRARAVLLRRLGEAQRTDLAPLDHLERLAGVAG